MSYSTLHKDFMEKLQAAFPDVAIGLHQITFAGPIYTFFLKFDSRDSLASQWENIAHYIAVNFQTALQSEFEIWNLYVFYQLAGPVDKAIKYKIENDTVSSRKIVIEGIEMDSEAIIAEHITNSDLNITIEQGTDKKFEKSPLITESMGAIDELSRKKNRTEFDLVFDAIIKKLKDEV